MAGSRSRGRISSRSKSCLDSFRTPPSLEDGARENLWLGTEQKTLSTRQVSHGTLYPKKARKCYHYVLSVELSSLESAECPVTKRESARIV
ncbi:hypothetical protein CCP3SC1AL1_450004 [Gammaproteobacteria bacterium]